MARHAGLLLPLFSARTTTAWGIGDIAALPAIAGWLQAGGFDRLMILPLGTMPKGESSPYSAISAMAIDPIYISIDALEDFAHAGGVDRMPAELRDALADVRQGDRVQYATVRAIKEAALDLAFDRFMSDEWGQLTTRAGDFAGYTLRERWWLDDYALFEAAAARFGSGDWRTWPAPLRDRDPHALDDARRQFRVDLHRHQYRQWIAESQWQAARADARAQGVTIVGDLPFGVGMNSPDVWSRVDEFRLDVSTGVPPDAFSATGQDWRLPMYDWDAIRATGYDWMRRRARRTAALFDGFRVDHLVGFYRTYGRPAEGPPFFSPSEEAAQIAQGEEILQILIDSGADVLAEDLGSIPPFVHASLARLGVPGFKVIRWERAWHVDGHPYIDPASYPATSVSMTGTHDNEPLATWWETTSEEERRAAVQMPVLASHHVDPQAPWTDAIRDAWLDLAYGSASDHLFLPVQDLFGWRDRINTPAIVDDCNWTWMLPWAIDRWQDQPQVVERAEACRALAAAAGRAQQTTSA